MPGPPSPTRQGLIMDSLWYIDQETGEWINSLALKPPTYNDDFTQMTVTLRPGIYWSDGVEFTADDLVFTVNNLKAHPGMNWSTELNLFVKSVQKVDQQTVVFQLTQSNPRFHYYFTVRYNAVWMQAKHIWQSVEDPMSFKFYPPVSLGAYEAMDSDPSGYWECFKRRSDWQRTTPGILTDKPGPAYIMTIYYGGSDRNAIAMSRHELDLLRNVDYEAFQALLKKTSTARPWYQDFPWAYPNELDARYLGFNLDSDTRLKNKDLRWALALALDIVDLQTEYIGGVARVTAIPQPATPLHMDLYHNPLEEWLKSFQIEIEEGQFYHPYDDSITERIAGWAQSGGGLAVNAIGDKWRAIFGLHSRFFAPSGQSTAGTGSSNTLRIKSQELDLIIDDLSLIHPDDSKVIERGQAFMKMWVENMYSIVTISFKKFITVDEYYWTGFPHNDNPFAQPLYWFGGGRFTFQYLQSIPTEIQKPMVR